MSDKPRGLRKRKDPVLIPDFLCTEEFLGAFEEFLQLRKSKKGKDTDYAIGLCVDDIIHLSAQGLLKTDREQKPHHDRAVELVQYAIYRKWTAIFKKPVDDDWMPPGKQKQQQPQVYARVIKKTTTQEPIKIEEAMTEEQKQKVEQTMYEHLDTIVQQTKRIPDVWNYDAVFSHMKRADIIKDTNEMMVAFKENIIRWLDMEMNARKLANDLQGESLWKAIRNNPEQLKSYCRKKRVQDFFQNKYNLMPF